MSFLEFVTTPEFLTGGALGILGTAGTFVTTRASDRRKFAQEDKVLDRKDSREDEVLGRKELREDKLRDQENLYAVATEYVEVCSDVLQNSIDTKGIFNAIRDMFYDRAGKADPNVDAKLDRATDVVEDNKRLMTPFNKLRLVAPVPVLNAAVELNAAILAVMRTTTEPFAAPVTLKTAGDRLEDFINVFRAEIGREEYTRSDAYRSTQSFLENLKRQADAYMEEARTEMLAAGFRSTPWDSLPRR